MTRRLAEVARKVGVSEATVSRVLNGKPGVSESTRQAVLTALDVLGYERPTKLRGERARLVGLVLPELQNPIFPAFAEVIGGALAQHGFTPGAVHPDRGRRLRGRLRRAPAPAAGLRHRLRRRPATPRRTRRTTTTPGWPSATCRPSSSTPRSTDLDFPRVSCDDAVAIEQAIGHLLSLGHTTDRAARSGPATTCRRSASSRRPRPIAEAGRHRRCGPTRSPARCYSLEGGQAAATRLLEAGVTGIVCASDPLALGAIRAAAAPA